MRRVYPLGVSSTYPCKLDRHERPAPELAEPEAGRPRLVPERDYDANAAPTQERAEERTGAGRMPARRDDEHLGRPDRPGKRRDQCGVLRGRARVPVADQTV